MTDDIELMHSYQEFPGDVLELFGKLCRKYDLQARTEGICSVDFENSYCRLNFNMDRYDLQALLFRKDNDKPGGEEKEAESVYAMACKYGQQEDFATSFPRTSYGDRESIRRLLSYYAQLIDKCLAQVLKGEISI